MVIEIPLTKNQVTIIDGEHGDLIRFRWCAMAGRNNYYAGRLIYGNKKSRHLFLHRVILERKIGRPLEKGEFCDHINGDTLDNREENLRVATGSENAQNVRRHRDSKSGYKGVSFTRTTKRWRAEIMVNRKRKHLGYFDTPEEAHKAYCEAAVKYFGEFARFE